jgi:Ni,Fe-hydrogenase I small subunit
MGRAWTRSAELDVVAMSKDDNPLLVGECKWLSRKIAPAVLDDLQRRVMRFGRLHRRQLRYALFSRSGFTKPLERRAAREGVLLFEGAELRQL